MLAKLVAAPRIVGENSSKVTLVALWSIVFQVGIWQVIKVVVPLNNTRTKGGGGDPVPTGSQRITSSSSSSKEVNPSIIAGQIGLRYGAVGRLGEQDNLGGERVLC
jgi:hypothetical protein